jgi:hypothetical protein
MDIRQDAVAPESGTTRRRLLGGAALAGGLGLGAIAGSEPALAATRTLDGFNSVREPPPNSPLPGAAGTGNVDDAPSIQAWIDISAGTANTRGATVYFPPGTYRIDTPLLLPSNSTLVGHGSSSVIKAGPNYGAAALVRNKSWNSAGDTDICVENLALDGSSRASFILYFRGRAPGSTTGDPGDPCRRIFLRRIESFGNDGATTASSNVCLHFVEVAAVQQCHVHNSGKDGITLHQGSRDVLVEGNLVRNCGYDHIAAYGSDINIVGNFCDARTAAAGSVIGVRAGQRINVVGNYCRGGKRAGIDIMSLYSAVDHVQVVGNMVLEAGNTSNTGGTWGAVKGSGISIFIPPTEAWTKPGSMKQVSVRDNFVVAPRYNGITLLVQNPSFDMHNVAVSGNTVWMDWNASYRTDDSADPGSGIACMLPQMHVEEVRISENELHACRGSGIKVVGGYMHDPLHDPIRPTHFQVIGNRVHKSGSAAPRAAIHVEKVAGATISGNRGDLQEVGLKVVDVTDDLLVLGNTFTNNAGGKAVDYTPGSPGPSRLRIRDNPGFDPWNGRATLSGGWSGSGPFTKQSDSPIRFAAPFPGGQPPIVHVTAQGVDAFAVAADVTDGAFTARLIAGADPGPGDHTVAWSAEPLD